MKPNEEPNRSAGGTFIRDKDGVLMQHIPPTQPAEKAKSQAQKSAPSPAESTAKKAKG